jgi:hypothetical protein
MNLISGNRETSSRLPALAYSPRKLSKRPAPSHPFWFLVASADATLAFAENGVCKRKAKNAKERLTFWPIETGQKATLCSHFFACSAPRGSVPKQLRRQPGNRQRRRLKSIGSAARHKNITRRCASVKSAITGF